MKQFHILLLKSFFAAFFTCLSIFIFLLLMQFLMQYINQIAGKDLPFVVILEFIFSYFSFIFMLAVPMSCLVASLFTAYRLKDTKAFSVIQNAGVSYLQLIFPLFVVGLVISGGMWYMNSYVQPKSTLRSRAILQSIRAKQPAFQLEDNVFYSGIPNYGIRAKKVVNGNVLIDVILFDNSLGGVAKTVLSAQKATLISEPNFMILRLENGEFHQYKKTGAESYQKIAFKQYETAFNTQQQNFKRVDGQNFVSDRTFDNQELNAQIDTLWNQKVRIEKSFKGKPPLASLEQNTLQFNAYRIEKYKRQVFSFACLIFLLLGIPIGLYINKGGLAIIAGIATLIFTTYWVLLITAEKAIENAVVQLDPLPAIWGMNGLASLFVLGSIVYFSFGRFWKLLFSKRRHERA